MESDAQLLDGLPKATAAADGGKLWPRSFGSEPGNKCFMGSRRQRAARLYPPTRAVATIAPTALSGSGHAALSGSGSRLLATTMVAKRGGADCREPWE